MARRPIRGALWALVAWGVSASAHADVLPPPGRPEWNDTPLPMPAEPGAQLFAATAVMLALAAVLWLRRSRT